MLALRLKPFALFMIMLDNTVVNVALPAIQRDLHITVTELEWIVTGYALSFAVLMLSGDQLWKDGKDYTDIPNMVNIMGRMEYMKMVAGCSAALTSQTGNIGFLGPLINDETRRLAASAFLGAKYCWTNVLGNDAADLTFSWRSELTKRIGIARL